MARIRWVERRFEFNFPVELYPEVIERIRGTPARVADRLAGVSPGILTRRSGRQWSVQEHAGHLADLDEVIFLPRLDEYDRGLPTLRATDMTNRDTEAAKHNAQTLEQVVERFRAARSAILRRLEPLGLEAFARTARHPRLGMRCAWWTCCTSRPSTTTTTWPRLQGFYENNLPMVKETSRLNSIGMRQSVVLLLSLAALAGCRTGRNYGDPESPRYAGGPRSTLGERAVTDTLRLVSFNLKLGLQVDSAIALLEFNTALRGADLILLQEMDEKATERIATALDMWYVYYPAIFYHRTRRHFGNAVLSRWPIVEDRKLVLPHLSRFGRTQRVATAATIRVGPSLLRVYSAHLGTMADLKPGARREQMQAILADAAPYQRVVIGGDMNDVGVGRVAREMGYAWPTERGPPTHRLGRLDHIFLRGLESPDTAAAGTVMDVRRTSDHLPVWAVGVLR